ncbi:hydroxysqualene dehydroxylase HpnE [Variovorax sp. PCZ-1]|uniref:hydroxysqualene dehydroxylase HpnE n=1 Tax=Variovorax sp. PCZ-1 TaxID=2835533 RepID=UPI001BCE42BE|nr:hydroxysqualene dehydroxylase HpnE [Variovorax sp. PCZ-1]MBS7806763.1 hydroxysqualene dehydroxylase HpnE [Variovorax sp. PCZ-1]
MKVLVAGAGWAGLSAAIELTKSGHQVTLIEASRHLGGRARALDVKLPDGSTATLDNGQHILIGAYSETLRLMREVGINPQEVLLRIPLTLRFPDGQALGALSGATLQLPDWKNPLIKGLDVAWGVMRARGWSWADKLSLLRTAAAWRLKNFECEPHTTVASLCKRITQPVMQMLIEPLCVSALNTPADRASGQVFLRIMRDSLFAATNEDMGSSNLLLPKTDLGSLFPQAAAAWLAQRGCEVRLGERLTHITSTLDSLSNTEHSAHITCRRSDDLSTNLVENYDAIVLATPPVEAARIAKASGHTAWADTTDALHHEAIATVYAYAPDAKLPCPMMALKSSPAGGNEPAQFVFDRGALTGQTGLLAFVVSASQGDAATIESQAIAQGQKQLGLPNLQALQTIMDKRATFACTPALQRPSSKIAANIIVCGDYVEGPYPSTLEGAIRSRNSATAVLQASK